MSFFLRQSQNGLAFSAFFINMRFAVSEFVLHELESSVKTSDSLQKFHVFLLSCSQIPGK